MKWCLYARRCLWGNACHPGYCAIEEDECKMDDEAWEMLDLDADLQRRDENEYKSIICK